MITFATLARTQTLELLRQIAEDLDIKLSIYEGRPTVIAPPHAFIDRVSERLDHETIDFQHRHPRLVVKICWGLFDSKDAVLQRDRFVDAFVDWFFTNPHAWHANTLQAPVTIQDDPSFVAQWSRTSGPFYATEITVEGLAFT